MCWQSSGGSFGVCSPRQAVVPADTLHYPLESLQGVAGATSTNGGFAGSRAAPRRCLPRQEMHFWKDPGWIWSPNPPHLALRAGSTKGNRVWQNRWFSPKPSLTNTRATLELPKCPVSGSLIFPVLLWSAENRSSGNCLREREGVFHFRGPTSQFIPPLLSLLSASSVQVGRGLMWLQCLGEQGWSCSLIHFP